MNNSFQDIQEKLKSKYYLNEEHIRFSLVARILLDLGWNIWDPKEVYTEFPVARTEDNTKVDIALFLRTNFPSVFIEIKGPTKIDQNLQIIEKQLRDYNRNNTATFTIITDGQHWRFYYSQTQGEFSDKCYRVIDLLKEESQQLEDEFALLLSREKIESGEAKNVAEKYLELSTKQRALNDSLPEANKMILRNPLLNLLQALQDCVKSKGYQVNSEEVLQFLEKNSNIDSNEKTSSHSFFLNQVQQVTRNNNANFEKNTSKKTQEIEHAKNENRKNGTTLRVLLNGNVFQEKKAINTFINVIKFLGVERVKNNTNIGDNLPLMITESELKNYDPRYYKNRIDNQLYVFSHTGNERKKYFLEKIARQLNETILVEII